MLEYVLDGIAFVAVVFYVWLFLFGCASLVRGRQ